MSSKSTAQQHYPSGLLDKPAAQMCLTVSRFISAVIQTCRLACSRLHRNRLAALRYALFFLALSSWLLYFILAYLIPASPVLVPASLLYSRRPLLVVAHPDDESLFFGPTLFSLTRAEPKKSLNVLVLSSGNNYGLGTARKSELQNACKIIRATECIVLDRKDIQDDPKLWWESEVILPVIKSWVAELKADAIITFDHGGVSGHANHRAVSAAISRAVQSEKAFPPTFVLLTVPTFLPPRKYTGVFDLPLTSFRYSFRILRALFLPAPSPPKGAMVFNPKSKRQLADASKKKDATGVEPKLGKGSSRGDPREQWRAFDRRGLIVSSWSTWRRNVAAFWEHSSQRSWDRWLYVLASRYMWFNEVVKVEANDGRWSS